MMAAGFEGASIGRPAFPAREDESLRLARIPDGTHRTVEIAALVLATMFALEFAMQNSTGWLEALLFAGSGVAFGTLLYATFLWVRLRRAGPATLSFETKDVHVRGPDGRSHLAIGYDRVLSLERTPWPRKSSTLFVEGRLPLDMPDTLFASPRDIARLATEIHERVGLLPDGADRLRVMADRMDAGKHMFRRLPWVSLCLVASLGLIFVLQTYLGATDGERAVLLGASSGQLLLQGEIARLLTPALLHANLQHLAANAMVILPVGVLLEGFLGRARTVLLFGLPSAVGILASSMSDPTGTSLGASAGGMGMIGAFLAINVYRREETPSRLRFPATFLGVLLAVMLISELWWWCSYDHEGHAGGLLAGGACYWLMVRGQSLARLLPAPPMVTRLAGAVGIAYLLAFTHVLHAAWRSAVAS